MNCLKLPIQQLGNVEFATKTDLRASALSHSHLLSPQSLLDPFLTLLLNYRVPVNLSLLTWEMMGGNQLGPLWFSSAAMLISVCILCFMGVCCR